VVSSLYSPSTRLRGPGKRIGNERIAGTPVGSNSGKGKRKKIQRIGRDCFGTRPSGKPGKRTRWAGEKRKSERKKKDGAFRPEGEGGKKGRTGHKAHGEEKHRKSTRSNGQRGPAPAGTVKAAKRGLCGETWNAKNNGGKKSPPLRCRSRSKIRPRLSILKGEVCKWVPKAGVQCWCNSA